MVTIPREESGLLLEPFGKALANEGESEADIEHIYGDRSVSAVLITDVYLSWVARDRNDESEAYLKTLSGG